MNDDPAGSPDAAGVDQRVTMTGAPPTVRNRVVSTESVTMMHPGPNAEGRVTTPDGRDHRPNEGGPDRGFDIYRNMIWACVRPKSHATGPPLVDRRCSRGRTRGRIALK